MDAIAYEYVFTTVFDETVVNNGPVKDDTVLMEWIKNCVAAIKACSVSNSTQINHNGTVYKITVNNKGPLVPLPESEIHDRFKVEQEANPEATPEPAQVIVSESTAEINQEVNNSTTTI
jgi:2,4-dienoyl-CoA reductase-like NADH-dependent reductase (Old Yellow Enzyme family)